MNAINIGGIRVKIVSASDLYYSQDDRFLLFTEKYDPASQMLDIICKLPISEVTANPYLKKANWLGLSSPLLGSPQVQNYLHLAEGNADMLTIELNEDVVTIFDFKINCVSIFISDNFVAQHKKNVIGSLMFAIFMPSMMSMLVHSSAVVLNQRVAILLAPDEGGKTTAALLSTILSDDQVLIKCADGEILASGTPWGIYADNKIKMPVGGIFLLKKADRFSLSPLFPATLERYLWDEHKGQFAILPNILKDWARVITRMICNSVPAWTLSFPKDNIDWMEVDAVMPKRR
jgi:hypothetical protein